MTSLALRAAVTAALLLFVVGVPVVQASGVQSDGATVTFTSDAGQKDALNIKSVDADTVEFKVEDDTLEEGPGCQRSRTTRRSATPPTASCSTSATATTAPTPTT